MISDYVPHGYGMSDEQRSELRRRIHRSRVLYILPVAWFAGALFGAVAYAMTGTGNRVALALVMGVIAGLAGNILLSWIVGRALTPFVLQEMNYLGAAVCTSCGYPLQGIDQHVERCPECGASLRGDQ